MKRNKQFAVIGLGRFGASVAKTLHDLGHEVLAIDNNEEKVNDLTSAVTHVVQADSTDEKSLNALGLRNFDAVIVAIGADVEANVVTTLLLKEMGVNHIVAKARNALHGKMLEKIGANRVVYPERDMAYRIAHNLVSMNVLDYIELSPNLSIVEITAPRVLVGRTLADTDLRARYAVNIVAIKRGEQLIVSPLPQENIQSGDVLVAIGSNRGIADLEVLE